MKCDFCNKEFKSISSLNYHQRTAKYCLEIQGKDIGEEYKCEYCEKIFSTKYSLNCHIDVCKESKEQEREKYKEYKDLYENMKLEMQTYKILLSERNNTIKERDNSIKSLEKNISELKEMLDKAAQTISDIAKQPKNTTNNTNIKTQTNNNIQNILSDHKTYEDYTNRERILSLVKDNNIEEYFWKGQRGVAEFVYDRIAKTDDGKMIICCTDPSRNRFKYKNASNIISEDIEAHIFHKKISEPIKQIYNDVHSNIQKEIDEKIITGSKDYSKIDLEFKKDIALEKNTEIQMLSNYEDNGDYRRAITMHLKV